MAASIAWCAGAAAAQPVPQTVPESVVALQHWKQAVERHAPGTVDEWALSVARMTYADRRRLDAAMGPLLRFIAQQSRGERVDARGDVELLAWKMARDIDKDPGCAVFLKRAAVLHVDAAILWERAAPHDDRTAPPPTLPQTGGSAVARMRGPMLSPLLTNTRLVATQDGQIVGDARANWNWPFGRSIVDLILLIAPSPETTAFASDWYHATAGYMQAWGLYAEVAPHLEQAVLILPRDARILFDRGAYSELRGLPFQQILREDRTPGRPLTIPPAEATNKDAEEWFRRAIDADSGFAEARVRYGRLLDVSGRHQEALDEIERALALKPTDAVAFFGHLFAGRAALSLDRLDVARRQFAEASSLFPEAQSALLAQSQAALRAGDIPTARELAGRLKGNDDRAESDPWWLYPRGLGRDSDNLLVLLWSRVKAAKRP